MGAETTGVLVDVPSEVDNGRGGQPLSASNALTAKDELERTKTLPEEGTRPRGRLLWEEIDAVTTLGASRLDGMACAQVELTKGNCKHGSRPLRLRLVYAYMGLRPEWSTWRPPAG